MAIRKQTTRMISKGKHTKSLRTHVQSSRVLMHLRFLWKEHTAIEFHTAHLERNIAMLSPGRLLLLATQNIEVVDDDPSCVTRPDDVIDETWQQTSVDTQKNIQWNSRKGVFNRRRIATSGSDHEEPHMNKQSDLDWRHIKVENVMACRLQVMFGYKIFCLV